MEEEADESENTAPKSAEEVAALMKARQAAAKKKLEGKKGGSSAAAAAAAEAKARAAVAQLGQSALVCSGPFSHPPVQRPARLHRAASRAGEARPRLSAAEGRLLSDWRAGACPKVAEPHRLHCPSRTGVTRRRRPRVPTRMGPSRAGPSSAAPTPSTRASRALRPTPRPSHPPQRTQREDRTRAGMWSRNSRLLPCASPHLPARAPSVCVWF